MKLYRYMSMHEFKKYLNGEIIEGRSQEGKKSTFDKGLCFLTEENKSTYFFEPESNNYRLLEKYRDVFEQVRLGNLELINYLKELSKDFEKYSFEQIYTPEECFKFLQKVVNKDILVEFEIDNEKLEKLTTRGIGLYGAVEHFGLYGKFDDKNKKRILSLDEISLPYYSKELLSLSSFSKVIYDKQEKSTKTIFKSNSLFDLNKYNNYYTDYDVFCENEGCNTKIISYEQNLNSYKDMKDIDYYIDFGKPNCFSIFANNMPFSEEFQNKFKEYCTENFDGRVRVFVENDEVDVFYLNNNNIYNYRIKDIIDMFYITELKYEKSEYESYILDNLISARSDETFFYRKKVGIQDYKFIHIISEEEDIKIKQIGGMWKIEDYSGLHFRKTSELEDLIENLSEDKWNIKAIKNTEEFNEVDLSLSELKDLITETSNKKLEIGL